MGKKSKHYDRLRFNSGQHRRILLTAGVLGMLAFGPVCVRLYNLMIRDYDYYARLALRNQTRTTRVTADRGIVYDRNMNILACSQSVENVYLDPHELKQSKADIPAIGITCTNPQVTLGNDHYFRICFLDPFQGTVLANFAQENFAAKKAYCLAKLGDDYSVGLVNYFIEAFEALGGEVVFETFPEGTSDFAAYVANAKNQGADVFFSPVSIEAAGLIIEQASTQGMAIPILAGDTWDSNVVLAAAKDTNVQIYVTTFFVEGSQEPQVLDFVNGFRNYINTNATAKTNNGGNDEISAVSAMGFDAYYVALEALKAAGSTKGTAVKAALPGISYTGVSGLIEVDATGDAKRDVAYVKQVNNETGKWDFIAVQSVK